MRTLWILVLVLVTQLSWAQPTDKQRKIFTEGTERLKQTKIHERAPKVGERFPDLQVGPKKISEWIKDRPLILTFYRGGWCPYCIKQLKEMQAEKGQVAGAQIVAVAPESDVQLQKTKSKNGLEFTLIPDKNNDIARQLGIAFQVDKAVAAEYQALGIDLSASQGILPLPATFVIGRDGIIHYAFADADYTQRAQWRDVVKSVNGVMAPAN